MQRRLISNLAIAAFALAATAPAWADDAWPSRTIHIVVPYPAGGAADPPVRVFAQKLQEVLGQAVVIDNVSGSGGTIGTARVARATPDGYTLGMASVGTLCIVPYLYSSPGYDSQKNFTPVSELGEYANVLVVKSDSPYHNLGELIAAAKQSPGKLTYGSSGNGSSNHLAAELLSSMTGTKFLHVPFRGTAPAMTEMLAGRLTFMFDQGNSPLPYIKEGRLRALGVSSAAPQSQMPDVPAISQTVPGFQFVGWIGLVGPAGLPPAVVAKLNAAAGKVLAGADFAQQYATLGFTPHYTRPDEFAATIRKDYDFWGPVVKSSGAKID